MNALTITPAALHAALSEIERVGRILGTTAYAGGIAALRSLFAPPSGAAIASVADQVRRAFASVEGEDIAAAIRFAEDHQACRACGRVYTIDMIRSCESGEPICDDCWPGLVAETAQAKAQWDAIDAGPAPTLAQGEAQPAYADSLPSADPPIAIPPLPAGPEDDDTSAHTEAPPAAEAAERTFAPAPAPPPVLAPEGISSPPEASHASPGDVSPSAGPRPTIFSSLTQGQKDLLVALWPDRTISLTVILARVNALDGATLKSDSALYNIMPKLGMPARGVLWLQQDQAADAAPIEAQPAPESAGPEPAPLPPPAEPPAAAEPPPETPAAPALSFPDDRQGREVWEAFDSGMSVRAVGADFGIPLSTLTNTHAQWQLARRKELSA